MSEVLEKGTPFAAWDSSMVIAWLEVWVGVPYWYIAAIRTSLRSGAMLAVSGWVGGREGGRQARKAGREAKEGGRVGEREAGRQGREEGGRVHVRGIYDQKVFTSS